MKRKYLILTILASMLNISAFAQSTDDLNLSAMIQPADPALFVHDSTYYNWCNSIIKDDDGTYHLFYSRWPKSIGFYSWLTHSEIAHATASKPEGPYRMGKTVLKARKGYWDSVTAHNVNVKKFDDNYYMYYTSTNTGKEKLSENDLVEAAKTGYSHKYWPLLRSNQRTGVAMAQSLEGPWERMDKPMIEPHGPIGTVTVNPAICRGEDSKYYLIIKGDDVKSSKPRLIQAIGTSDSPTGPFRLEDKPAFADIPTEDVSMWYDKNRKRYYAIFHAHGGNFIGLITSEDGVNWQKAKHYEVCKKEVPLKDGTVMKVDRMERPFVYVENGVPTLLSFGVKKGNDAFIVFFKLTEPKEKQKVLADRWEFRGIAIDEPGYHVWGSSPIKGEDGKIHLFATRWKIEHKFDPGWRSHSEIAHYIADKPEGPFRFLNVVLTGTGKKTWDKCGIHNPAIHKVGDKYALLYISNDNYKQPPHPKNQKIGMLIADNLNGPWKKVGKDGCILSPSSNPDHWTNNAGNGVVNPALLVHPKGGYLLYFKSNKAKMGVAFAEHIEGPYVMYPEPVTRNNLAIEDGYAFIWKDKICLLTTDNHGILNEGGGILWSSDDGITFDRKEAGFYPFEYYVGKDRLKNAKGIYGKMPKFERPQALMENGEPAWLYVPSGFNMNGDDHTIVHVLKLK